MKIFVYIKLLNAKSLMSNFSAEIFLGNYGLMSEIIIFKRNVLD